MIKAIPHFLHTRFNAVNLRTRLATSVVVSVLLSTAILTALMLFYVRKDMKDDIVEDQGLLMERTVADMDQRMGRRRAMVNILATNFPTAILADSDAVQRHLTDRPEIKVYFDNLLVIRADGEVIANVNLPDSRGGSNFASRDYLRDTLSQKTGVISKPFRSALSLRPIVVVTAPIQDATGNISHVLMGTLDLGGDSFFGSFSGARVGKTGYFTVLSAEGIFISHPNAARVLESAVPLLAKSPALKLGLGGFEGTVESVDNLGVSALFSFKRLHSTGWIVTSVLPADEAFAPVQRTERRALVVALLLAMIAGPLAWWLTHRQLAPLHRLGLRIDAVRQTPALVAQPVAYPPTEIGRLAHSFDDLMRERLLADTQRKLDEIELQRSKAFLQSLIDHLPVVVYSKSIDAVSPGRFVLWNKAAERITGYRTVDVIGRTDREIFSLVEATAYEQHDQNILAARSIIDIPVHPMRRPDGDVRILHTQSLPFFNDDGTLNYILGIAEDITEQRERSRALAKEQAELKMVNAALHFSEQRLRTITDNVPALIGYIDTEQRLQFCNIHYSTMFGFDTDKILGQTLRSVFGEVLYSTIESYAALALAGKKTSFERTVEAEEGIIFQQVEYVPDIDANGTVHGFYALVTDVTARRVIEQRLAANEHNLRTITDNLPVAITYIDADQHIRFANATMYAWTGTRAQTAQNRHLRDVVGPTLYEERRNFYERALAGERVEFIEPSHVFHQERILQSVFIPDVGDDGSIRGFFSLSSDITAQQALEDELRCLARFDSLTGLANRANLYEALEAMLERSRRSGLRVAVLFLDIDHFKQINDTFGHGNGDVVLQEFAARLKKLVRSIDIVARLAGDEFVIVLDSLKSQAEAEAVAAKILQSVREPVLINGQALTITTSLGLAYSNNGVPSGIALIERADAALYQAKSAGRDTMHAGTA